MHPPYGQRRLQANPRRFRRYLPRAHGPLDAFIPRTLPAPPPGIARATPPPPGHTGLFHIAFLYPDGAADHGVSEAVYLRDPDENGVELYCDAPEADWPRDAAGRLAMVNEALDLGALLAEVTR